MKITKKLVTILVVVALVLTVLAVTSVILNSGKKINTTNTIDGSESSSGNVGVQIVPPIIEEEG